MEQNVHLVCAQIFGVDSVPFQQLPELVNRYLAAPDPIILHYTLNPTVPPPERPSAWDVEIKMEDTALKNRMAVTVNTSKESAQTLLKIDEEVPILHIPILRTILIYCLQIALLAQSLHNSHMKRTFLESFASDPAQFIQTWLESQSRDLENIMGSGPSEGATVRQEELKRSEFFQLPWVEEVRSISLYLFLEVADHSHRPWRFRKGPASQARAWHRRLFGYLLNMFVCLYVFA